MPTPTPAADGAHDRSPRAPRPTRPDPSIPPTAPTGPGALLGGRRVRLLPAILALALGSFAIGTTEFAIMGLLPQAVADLGIGLEAGGVLISMYALGVVVGAPLLAAAFARVDRRLTSIVLMLLFLAGHVAAFLAPDAATMMAARFICGLPHGAYFSAAALAAADLAGPARRGQAVAWVMAGLSVANVLGVPAATALGQSAGWRWMFVIVATCAALCVAATAWLVPPVPAPEGASVRRELRGLASGRLWATVAVGVLGFAGMFALYTYIAPLLTTVSGLDERWVPAVLALYGVGMVVGTLVGGALTDRDPVRTLRLSFALSAVFLLGVGLTAQWAPVMVVFLFLVAVSGSGIAPSLQVLLVDSAPTAPQLAGSLNHSALNMANAMGAWVGAAAIGAGASLRTPPLIGAAIALGGLVLALLLVRRTPAVGAVPHDGPSAATV
ncbi:MFS transporter [Micrococcus luteus]|nr:MULTISPECIES: MFS transporter [Micrococcus]MBS9536872.1 MFS transporter [Micrococcus luteus]MCD0179814.1 MFS transporter [Micrococcus luteus]MCV7456746.1 MFS transporter [Micrococcus luteus]MCV7490334.1 MFS transporter [Micrococcus luteus]MCV7555706.1 MFS transporter [Micrococcus luteus]